MPPNTRYLVDVGVQVIATRRLRGVPLPPGVHPDDCTFCVIEGRLHVSIHGRAPLALEACTEGEDVVDWEALDTRAIHQEAHVDVLMQRSRPVPSQEQIQYKSLAALARATERRKQPRGQGPRFGQFGAPSRQVR